MTALALLFIAISFSLFITRTAAVMLELTGMSRESARFQARAAYCGVGYTSRETEGIVEHPVRRKIVSTLMLLGNAGTATVVATLVLSFRGVDVDGDGHVDFWMGRLVLLIGGLLTLYLLSRSAWVDQKLHQLIEWALEKYTGLDLHDYTALLHLEQGYSVLEVEVQPGDWLEGNTLSGLALAKEGVLILGIRRTSGEYIGAPTAVTKVMLGDTLTLYGKLERLEELNKRRIGIAGLYAHQAAIDEHTQEVKEGDAEANNQSQSEPASRSASKSDSSAAEETKKEERDSDGEQHDAAAIPTQSQMA